VQIEDVSLNRAPEIDIAALIFGTGGSLAAALM
jgi:hypothetical protein